MKTGRSEGELMIVYENDYDAYIEEKEISQVVVEHGTIPIDDIYYSLKNNSYNLGEVDYYSLIEGKFNEIIKNIKGKYFLYRVGDSVSSRNIHAAIYDSLRICKNL